MADFSVETGVDIPKSRIGRPSVYPFATMQVGDSFFVEGPKSRSAVSSAYNYGVRHSMVFQTRTEENGARIWRVG